MSADAATLPCPICLHTGVFDSAQSLRDKLIFVSTHNLTCPVCQEEVCGLDKLTIHLFRHVKLPTTVKPPDNSVKGVLVEPKMEQVTVTQQKKSKPSAAKNKTSVASNATIKYVKIYPKLPVIAMNTETPIDITQHHPIEECKQMSTSVHMPIVKSEILQAQINNTCNLCGLQFIDENILKMHRCLVHNIEENSNESCLTRHYCHLCPKNFKMRGSLMVHLRVAHFGFPGKSSQENQNNNSNEKKVNQNFDNKPINSAERNDNKQWQCDVCHKCFTTKYFLKKHKRLHTGETPYACTQCNKTFTFQQSYHKHLLYHNDEKPHTCSHCGRAFKELSTLHNHQRIHTGEKPFSCETCGKCFRQRVSYLVHRRIHTGVMPYKCTACDKSFRYKVSQRTHKCQAQPPGTVVRQTGDLVEKLKKKQVNDRVTSPKSPSTSSAGSPEFDKQPNLQQVNNSVCINKQEHASNLTASLEVNEQPNFLEISESNAELVRRGAKLSLEDMESESFTLISDNLFGNTNDALPCMSYDADYNSGTHNETNPPESQIEDLIESIPVSTVDSNLPSPSEILKNLCLSTEGNSIEILNQSNENATYENCKNLNDFL